MFLLKRIYCISLKIYIVTGLRTSHYSSGREIRMETTFNLCQLDLRGTVQHRSLSVGDATLDMLLGEGEGEGEGGERSSSNS